MNGKLKVGFFLPRATRVMAGPEEEEEAGWLGREVGREQKQGCSPTPGTSRPISQAPYPPESGPCDAQNIPQGWQSTKLDTSFL